MFILATFPQIDPVACFDMDVRDIMYLHTIATRVDALRRITQGDTTRMAMNADANQYGSFRKTLEKTMRGVSQHEQEQDNLKTVKKLLERGQ